MQVSVENSQGLERRITVAVPAQKIDAEVQKRLQNLAGRIKLDGFRPGKVPFAVVQKRFGGQVRQEVVGDLVTSSFYAAAAENNLRPAGTPVIETQSEDAKKGLEFTARFEVYPEVKIQGVDQIKIERPKADISSRDIDNMLEKLRKQRVNWQVVSRAAQKDDRVTLDYKATIDGQSFEGGEGSDLQVVIGSRNMIEGFEDALVGTSAGKTVEMNLTFPQAYFRPELSGKAAHFTVAVKNIEEPKLPAIDAEFVQSFGISDGSIEKLRADLEKNMARELTNAVRGKVKNAVMDALLAANKLDVPRSMIDSEAKNMAQQMNDQMRWQAGTTKPLSIYQPEQFRQQGERRVALGLILAEIIKQNGLKATPSKVRKEVELLASAYGEPQSVIDWYYQDRNRLREVESLVLEDEIVEWVLERAQVTDRITTFDELMTPSAT
jgi:trigger factor